MNKRLSHRRAEGAVDSWIYWGISSPHVPVEIALTGGIAASVVAAVAESVRSPVNDNIRVGAAATAVLLVLYWMFVNP